MHVISFIITESKVLFGAFDSNDFVTCKNAMLSPPTKTKVEVNDEGSLHFKIFSICMHMRNLQNKCEWMAGA